MNIQQLHIYGFGKWVDHVIHFPDDQLICLYGKNESGKSTLQNFIMFMLFGLPPKQRKYFQPKTSSRMGGRMVIADEKIGPYTIERLDGVRNGAAICYFASGEEEDESWLKDRLNGMTTSIYEAIFSFSALDLVNIKDMKDEDLGDTLLTIGLTGYNNIYKIEQQLNRELDQLFKPYGKVPQINKQLNLLDERYRQLTNSKNEEMTYRDEREAYELLQTELTNLQITLQAKQDKKVTIEKLLNSLPIIHDFFSYERQVSTLPKDISFPEQGIERLRTIQGQLLPIESEYAVFTSNEEKLKKNYENAEHKLLEQSIYKQAKTVKASQRVFESNEEELTRCEQTIEKLQLQIDSKLDQLQIGLDKQDLHTITLPFHIEQQWNKCKQEANRLDRLKEEVSEQSNGFKKQKHILLNDRVNKEKRLLPDTKREKLHEQIIAFENYEEQKQRHKETIDERNNWITLKQQKQTEQRNILLASMLLASLCGGIAYLLNMSVLYNVAIFIIVLGGAQFVWGKRSLRETDMFMIDKQPNTQQSPPASEEEIRHAKELLANDQHLKETIAIIEQDMRQINMKLLTCEDKLANIMVDQAKNNQNIAEQHKLYPFLHGINVAYWPELFYPVRHIVEMHEDINELTKTISSIQVKQKNIEETIDEFLRTTSMLDLVQARVMKKYQYINELIVHQDDLMRQMKQWKNDLLTNKQQQRDLEQKMKIYKQEVNTLFSIANVNTEEEFYKKEKKYAQKRQAELLFKKAHEQLQAIFPENELKQIREHDLDHHQLNNQLQKVTDAITSLEENIEQKREQQTQVYAKLLKLESSETASELMHRFSLEKDQLHQLAKKWSTIKTAKFILSNTKRSYLNNYLGQVIDKMALYFSQITNNRYVKVFAPTKEQPFQVESAEGIRYTITELSQGTIDQLYISLRIAMGEIVGENQKLPFIIDDAFVHFDAVRLKRMLNIIASIAKEQQVIVFTCKQNIVNYLRENHVVYIKELDTVRIN